MGIFERRRPSPGEKATTLLTGVGIGAVLMYVLDPEKGRRRRALVRDKAVSLANQTGRAFARKSRDLTNRAKGAAAEIKGTATEIKTEIKGAATEIKGAAKEIRSAAAEKQPRPGEL